MAYGLKFSEINNCQVINDEVETAELHTAWQLLLGYLGE